MQQASHNLLFVEKRAYLGDLLSGSLDSKNGLNMINAGNPEEAEELIKINSSFSVIFSEDEFNKSENTGRTFLKRCQNIAPLASTVLCSGKFSEGQCQSMVQDGEISSYVNRALGLINDSLVSSTAIGMETYKINLFRHHLDIASFESIDSTVESLSGLDKSQEAFEWELDPLNPEFKLQNREVELNQLFFSYDSVSRQAITSAEKIAELKDKDGIAGNMDRGRLVQVLERINHINQYLIKSRFALIKRTNRINTGLEQIEKNNAQYAKVAELIKRIRVDL
jgi:hypothetical protein